jgi:glucose/mannose-6-phosphate isomerase
MLDNLKYIHEKDPQDMLGVAEREWQQLEKNFEIKLSQFKPENIVYSGMGGSVHAAAFSQVWPGYNVPFEIVRNYDIPSYVSSKTLFISSSYSGNTEETLTSLAHAKKKGAYIVVICAGGELLEIAKKDKLPYVQLPGNFQPRSTTLYFLKAIVAIMSELDLIDGEKASKEVASALTFLKESAKKWQATVPTGKNEAKQIAMETAGKSVVIYGGPKTASLARKWKIGFNENAKQVAWWNYYPEFNHNEFIGWSEQPPIKPYCVIDLLSNLENPRILKRFEVSKKLLSGKRPDPIEVKLEGNNLLEQLVYGIMLGDFASTYAALLAGINPEPVALVEKLKKEIA